MIPVRVEAAGSHEELVALGGEYAELFSLQAANHMNADPAETPDPAETSDLSERHVSAPDGRLVGS